MSVVKAKDLKFLCIDGSAATFETHTIKLCLYRIGKNYCVTYSLKGSNEIVQHPNIGLKKIAKLIEY